MQENPHPLAPLLERVRTDVTAVRKKSGAVVWTREPLTDERLARHRNGGPARGVCPIRAGESTTLCALIDFDSHKGEVPWEEMQRTALEVIEALEDRGLHATPFRSWGGRGIHLVILWDWPQDARSVRAALAGVLERCGLADGTGGVGARQAEIFPKQDAVPTGGFGNQFVLPLAGQSVALDPIALEPIEPSDIAWRSSTDVDVLPPEPERPVARAVAVDLEMVRSAVDAIPNSGDHELHYDAWRDLIFAIHAATGGSSDGLELAHALSRKSIKYDEAFLDRNVWPHIRQRPDGITAATLFAEARKFGWAGDVLADFDDLGPSTDVRAAGEAPPPIAFATDDSGRPLASISNVMAALRHPQWTGIQIGVDTFRDEIMWRRDTLDWRNFRDTDYTRLRYILEENGFRPVSAELIKDCVRLVADEFQFDSAVEWIENVVPAWDGRPRIETFYPDYLDTFDTAYTRKVSMYHWTAMAGRALVAGIKADMTPIWVSKQGTRKTTAVAALAPSLEFFVEINFNTPDETLARMMRGRLVGEIAELRGLHTKDAESIKAWMSRTHETWIPKYREFATTYGRRVVFVGTTNRDEFLADETGNRRWLPVRVGNIDVEAIERDRLQLWAEARDRFKAGGIGWQGVAELAHEAHEMHRERDSWEDLVLPYLSGADPDDSEGRKRADVGLTTFQILTEALSHDATKINRSAEMRIAKICKFAGLNNKVVWRDGRSIRIWKSSQDNLTTVTTSDNLL